MSNSDFEQVPGRTVFMSPTVLAHALCSRPKRVFANTSTDSANPFRSLLKALGLIALCMVGQAAHAYSDNHSLGLFADVAVPVQVQKVDAGVYHGKKEVVFVDTSVIGYKALEAGVPKGVGIVEINGLGDGLAQMAKWAETHSGYDAIHILSHGNEATLRLGTAVISDSALSTGDLWIQLGMIGHALKANGDLLIYGCDVAKGSDGSQFVSDIARATGVNVAASTDLTGYAAGGGNWVLEKQTGQIDSRVLAPDGFHGVLADVVVSNDPGPSGTNAGGFSAGSAGQSFTATKTGLLKDVTVFGTSGSGTTLNIYAGAGIGGTLLATQSVADLNSAQTMDVGSNRYIGTTITLNSSVSITSGNVYTFELTNNNGVTLYYTDGANYSGGDLYTGGVAPGSQYDVMFDVTQADAFNNDGTLTAGPGVEATTLGTTIDSSTKAVDMVDFTLADGGTSDGLPMTISQIVVHVGGTSTNTERGDVVWRLNGPDVANAIGTYNAGTQTITFSGLSISIADGGFETYAINAYYGTPTGLTDGHTFTLSVDGDTDVTTGVNGTQMTGSNAAVTNGSGAAIDVIATHLSFTTEPAGSVSGKALTTQPVVAAVDQYNNVDVNFTGNVALTEASAGTLSGTTTLAASSGVATFTNVTYTATTDGESFTLTAASSGLNNGTANAVTSDIVLGFASAFSPATIGPGSTTVLTYTFDNSANAIAATGITFSNTLPTGMTIANPSGATTTCASGSLSATAGGNAISFSNYQLAAGGTCTLKLYVTDSTAGAHTNTTGALSSSLGSSGTASASLTVDTARPGFSMVFSPSTIPQGGTSTATYTVDNTYNGANALLLTINDTFPSGIVLASSPNATSNCNQTFTPTFTATPGSSSMQMQLGGVAAGSTCTIKVDVTATAAGQFTHLSSQLSQNGSNPSGYALAQLTVNPPPTVTDAHISISGASGLSGTYKIGDTITATWDNTSSGDNNSGITGVTVDFGAFGGSSSVAATNSGGIWTATYTVPAGSIDATYRNVSVSATSSGGTTTTADTSDGSIDNIAPVVTDGNLSISGGSGIGGVYKIGDVVTATWNNTNGGDHNTDTLSAVNVDFSAFGGGTVAATNSSSTWTAVYTITAGSIDGANKNVSLTVVDNAGNSKSVADTTNATVDNIAPTVTDANISISGATGTGGVFKVGDTVTASWDNTISGDNNTDTISSVTVNFSAFGGGSAVAAVNSAGTWTASYTLPSGSISGTNYNVSVTATDNAGNTTTTADTTNAKVDIAVPAAPSTPDLAAASDTGSSSTDNITSNTMPTFNGTAEANSTVTLLVDSSSIGFTTADGSGNWTFTPSSALSAGTHSITATATDSAGNTSSASAALSITIDTTAPAAPSTPDLATASDTGSSSTDNITSDTTPTFNGTAEANATVTLLVDNVSIGTTTADGSGNWSFTPGTAVASGVHAVTATATDSAGNVSTASSALSITIDASAPAAPSTPDLVAASDTGSSNTDNITSDTTPTFVGTAEANSTVTLISNQDGTLGTTTADGSGNWSFTVGTALSANTHNITARATDGAGNTSAASAALSVTIDTGTPSAPSALGLAAASDTGASSTDRITNDTTPTVTGSAEANATVAVSLDGSAAGSTTADGSGNWTFTPGTALADGVHSFTATATDAAGHTSAASAALSVTVDTVAPTVAITSTSSGTINTAFDVNIDFSENVSGFSISAITVSNATLSTFSGSGKNYTVHVTPTSDGAVSVNVGAAATTDIAGNGNVAGTALSLTYDGTAPALSSSTPANGSSTAQYNSNLTLNFDSTVVAGSGANTAISIYRTSDDSLQESVDIASSAVTISGSTVSVVLTHLFTPAESYYVQIGGDALTDTVGNKYAGIADKTSLRFTVADIPPVAGSDSATVNEDSSVDIPVLNNDTDIDSSLNPAAVTVATAPSHGSVSVNTATGIITYTPAANYNGPDAFTYTAADVQGGTSTPASVDITVNPVNDPPQVKGDVASTNVDTPVTLDVAANDTDPDAGDSVDTSTLTLISPAGHGTAQVQSGKILYTPATGFSGSDTFRYIIKDSHGAVSSPATVIVNVLGTDAAPTAANDTASGNEDTAIAINVVANDSDSDGTIDPTTVAVLDAPAHGSTSVNPTTGEITYTPGIHFSGADSFTYVVKDNAGLATQPATVAVTVNPVNVAPIANNDTLVMPDQTPRSINVLGNDSDVDGTLVKSSVAIVTAPTAGTATVNTTTGAITYAPGNGFAGSDSFTYRVQDNQGAWSAPATVTVTNQAANQPPLANTDNATTDEDTPVIVDVLANDSDVDGSLDATSVTVVSAPAHGTTAVNTTNGAITYTPAANYNGNDSFTYTVKDNNGVASAAATVNVQITPVNDAPTISGTPAATTTNGGNYSFTPTLADVDGDVITVTATNLPAWASLDPTTGAITGTPAKSDVGTYSNIVLTASDGMDATSLPAFSIEVQLDTDGDGIPDIIDPDDDNDGMPDVWEIAHGFNPLDPSDAAKDADGDGVSNLQEYLNGTNPLADDYPPVIDTPTVLSINATGLLTPTPTLTPPNAVDGHDGPVTAVASGLPALLSPGVHSVTWTATDAAGNSATVTQEVDVNPLISLSKDQTVGENITTEFKVLLNGVAPNYPLTVNLAVGGTAASTDYDPLPTSVTFNNGETEKTVPVTINGTPAIEGTRTVDISLTGSGNFGAKQHHVITIVEANVAPQVDLQLTQNTQPVSLLAQDGGNANFHALVTDPNAGDTHTYTWTFPAGASVTGGNGATAVLDPTSLTPGVYRASVLVEDSGTPPLQSTAIVRFEVVATAPTLSTTADANNDGIPDATQGITDSDRDGLPDYLDTTTQTNVMNEQVTDGDTFRVEADPGVKLHLGENAMNGGDGGVQLASGTIGGSGVIPADTITNVGGYFDFVISDLPDQGQSVNIVLPQRSPIPDYPVYRKFDNGVWYDFVQNASNSIASAPGSAGACPPPQSSDYTPGLHTGDWCVQLTIEDGGPNDADGQINGSVEDPGGVGTQNVVTITTTGHGHGGAFGGIMLALTGLLALSRRFGQRLRKLVNLMLILAALGIGLGVAPTPARAMDLQGATQAMKQNSFVEFGLFQINADTSAQDFTDALTSTGSTVDLQKYDTRRLAYDLALGYRYADHWSFLMGYLDLGDVKVNLQAQSNDQTALARAIERNYPVTGQGWTFINRFDYPLRDKLYMTAELGAYKWDGKIDLQGLNADLDLDGGTDMLLGAGVYYQVTGKLDVGLRVRRILFQSQPTYLWGLGVTGHF